MKINNCSYCGSNAVDIVDIAKIGESFTIDEKENDLWYVYCINCSTSSSKQKSREEAIIRWNNTFSKKRQYEDIF